MQISERVFWSWNALMHNVYIIAALSVIFLCSNSTRYLTSERSERGRYRVEHSKRHSIFSRARAHVLFSACSACVEVFPEGEPTNDSTHTQWCSGYLLKLMHSQHVTRKKKIKQSDVVCLKQMMLDLQKNETKESESYPNVSFMSTDNFEREKTF